MDVRDELCSVGKFMMNSQLAWGNAGNISARISPDRLLISASGTFLGELAAEDVVECSIGNPKAMEDGKKPSKELAMHAAVYEERPEIGAVLHASPFYSTLIACSNMNLPSNLFVETMYYLERVARVPYAHPGSQRLADLVRQQAKKANILLLEHHGVLVYDTNLKEARNSLQVLEMACRMLIVSGSAGITLQGLPAETVHSFLTESGYKPVRKWETE